MKGFAKTYIFTVDGGISMKLKDRVALITGGASWIGRGIALAMAKEGAKVVIVDLNDEAGEKTLAELKEFSDALYIHKDISVRENLSELVQEVVEHFGELNILVNNAHVSRQKPFMETTPEDVALSFNTGYFATFYLMQEAYEELKKSNGKVINFASGAGINGQPTQAAYASAKEAIRGLTRVVANEWGPDGINVNIISPLALTSGIEIWSKHDPEQYNKMVNGIPLRYVGDPEQDIGRVAVFLASEDSKYITGQTIMVDGGTTKIY